MILRTKHLLFLICLNFVTNCLSSQKDIYNFSWSEDKYIFAAGVSILGTAYIIDKNQDLITEGEINNLNSLSLSSINQSAVDNFNRNAADLSDYLRDGIFFVPLFAFISPQIREEWKDISMMYLETLLVNTSLTFINQSLVSKERPFIYNQSVPLEERITRAARRSFYSGHVSHVATLSFFTASILNDYYPNSKQKWMWNTGAFLLPALTAYYRYEAGKHFVSDVAIGYAVGSFVGYFIPKFHKIKIENTRMSLYPSFNGMSIGLSHNF